MFRKRASGVLLHITSLPSAFGIGDLGPEAYRFVDFLKRSRQRFWQVLPLNPVSAQNNYSPYKCASAFAGNTLLISPECLLQDGWLERVDLGGKPSFAAASVDFRSVVDCKRRLLKQAFVRFQQKGPSEDYYEFVKDHAFWLEDYALFAVLKETCGNRVWNQWDTALRDRREKALKQIMDNQPQDLQRQRFYQYLFWRQWNNLRHYCHQQGVHLIGDLPIYVALDSTDVWSHPHLFKLTSDKRPKFKAGVPPDYFSRIGQLWGNPVYDWDAMKQDDYQWFIKRIAHCLRLFDIVRIDHFRGFQAYWEVPASHKTAVGGWWTQGPGADFFNVLYERLPFAQLFAEDLGHITADVKELMRRFSLSGMKVLQFGFSGDVGENGHCLHNHRAQDILYTGTHDNNTLRGWFKHETGANDVQSLETYLGHRVNEKTVAWAMIRLAMTSIARVCVFPMQDGLNLSQEARMNVPARARGNWRWRMRAGKLTPRLVEYLGSLTQLTGR